MKKRKILLCLCLIAVLMISGVVPAAASEPEDKESAEEAAAAEEDEDLSHLMDENELIGYITDFIRRHGIREGNFSFAFCYTGTGETFYYNPDQYINGASLYKLSLMMGLARKVSSGELQQTDSVAGMDISYVESRSLTYSDNEVSEAIIGYFNPFRDYRLMQAEIAGIPEEELSEEYFHSNTFSARFMMGVLKELWAHTEKYPNIIECLKVANPGEYFRRSLDGKYEVAQKYGGGDGYLHTAGIIYTPTPILLVVMSYRVTSAEQALAELAQDMVNYSITMDSRRDAILAARAEAERIAAAEAEAARLAAEQAEAERIAAEKAEAERLAAEKAEAERKAAEEADAAREPSAGPARTPAPTPAKNDSGSLRAGLLYVTAGALALLCLIAVIRKIRR